MLTSNTIKAALFGIVYFASVQLGTLFIDQGVAYFWPASGVACAFFIFSPKRLWLSYSVVFIPAYLFPLALNSDYSYGALCLLLLSNWLQSITAGILVQWKVKQKVDVNRLILQFKLILLAALAAPLAASLIGVTTFYVVLGHSSWIDYFIFWMIGNCTGILPTIVLCAVAMNWKKNVANTYSYNQITERILYSILFAGLTYFIIHTNVERSFFASTVKYFIFPALLFSSIRYKAQFTAIMTFILTCFAAYYAARGIGPYLNPELPIIHNVMAFDVLIIILTSTCLLLAATQYELEFAKLQLQIEKNEAVKLNQLKTLFIANVNHEIRTPITGILGAASLLKDTTLGKEQIRLLNIVDDASNHLLSLINDVLDLTKLDSEKAQLENEPLDIEEIIHNTVNSFLFQTEEKGLTFYVDCKQELPQFIGDTTAIKQVLSNLLSNAVKFTDHGYIKVHASYQEQLIIHIEDTGIGIAADKLDKVFENFMQEDASMSRRFGGTGLGLTICKKLINLMGGEINLKSQKGKGSRFEILLPLPIQTNQPTCSTLPSLTHESLLVLSNDELLNELLHQQFAHRVGRFEAKNWSTEEELLKRIEQSSGSVIINWEGKDRSHLSRLISQLIQASGRFFLVLPWSMDAGYRGNICVIHRPIHQSNLARLIANFQTLAPETQTVIEHKVVPPQTRRFHVLLAEDNPVNAMIARTMLERQGCSVVNAINGEQAIDKIKEYSFDFVLMDIQMPIIDGFEATRLIKMKYPNLPVVAFTANYNDQLQKEFTEAGMELVLSKPFKKEDLTEILRKII